VYAIIESWRQDYADSGHKYERIVQLANNPPAVKDESIIDTLSAGCARGQREGRRPP
jgi:hypothetical protein